MKETDTAAHLHVLVQGNERELCRVQLPLSALPNLAHMIPDVDRAHIETTGVVFDDVVARAIASGYRPQMLVDTSVRERSYRIWIE